MHTALFENAGGMLGRSWNKQVSEQVSSDHQKMSLAGAQMEVVMGGYVQRLRVGMSGPGNQGGMSHMTCPPPDRMTDTCENITFLQLCWRR